MIYRIHVLWLALLLVEFSFSQQTLADAYNSMLKSNPALQAAQLRVQSRNEAVNALKGARLPKVDISAGYQYLTEIARMQLDIPPFLPGMSPVSLDRPLGDHDKTELGITASYPL